MSDSASVIDGAPAGGETAELEVVRLSAGADDAQAWDSFVEASPSGTIFHQTAWMRVVEDAFRHKPRYLFAVGGGEIRGVLPLFEVRGWLSGRVFTSVPYAVYGGLCASDPAARRVLLDDARRMAEQDGMRHVELRHIHEPEAGLPTKELYSYFERALDPDPEVNLKAVPRKQRRMIRQGIKSELEPRRGWESFDDWYEVYAVNRKRLGSPPFPRRLFEAMREHYGADCELLTIWHEGHIVSGVVSLFYKDRVMPYYGAARPDQFKLAANDFMYWELMRNSTVAGYRVFDFGRSRNDTGPFHFKRHWGFQPKPLHYQYVLLGQHTMPQINPSNPKLQAFIKVWQRLPLAVTKWVGPPLTRLLPLD